MCQSTHMDPDINELDAFKNNKSDHWSAETYRSVEEPQIVIAALKKAYIQRISIRFFPFQILQSVIHSQAKDRVGAI